MATNAIASAPANSAANELGGGRIGDLLLAAGKLTEHDIARVVAAQRQLVGRQFGEIARQLGLVGEQDVQQVLALQFNYPHAKGRQSVLDARLVMARDPYGAQAEAYRDLRSQLVLRWFNDRRKAVTVVAPRAGDGCSTVAANLAIAFAQQGERTLLVDANLRSPDQHRLFGLKPENGLSTLLAGRGSIKAAFVPVDDFDHLTVICGGVLVPNPQELLGRVMFPYVMETVPASFDIVIVDAPPVLEFADAQLIAAQTAGCVVVMPRHRTRVGDIHELRSRLAPAAVEIVGAVLHDMEPGA